MIPARFPSLAAVFMFAQIASLLTLSATLVHSVLGCCWHHDHALHGHAAVCAIADVDVAAHASPVACGACAGHYPEPVSDHDEEPCPDDDSHRGCHDAQCVYVATDSGHWPNVLAQFATFVSPVCPNEMLRPAVLDVGFLTIDEPSPGSAAAVRAELQVWLI